MINSKISKKKFVSCVCSGENFKWETDLCDVTLTCEDKQIGAHELIRPKSNFLSSAMFSLYNNSKDDFNPYSTISAVWT